MSDKDRPMKYLLLLAVAAAIITICTAAGWLGFKAVWWSYGVMLVCCLHWKQWSWAFIALLMMLSIWEHVSPWVALWPYTQ
jgi:hypothetical protein